MDWSCSSATQKMVSMKEKSATISEILIESPFIVPRAWDAVTTPFVKSAVDILIDNVIWTPIQKKNLLKHPFRTKIRFCMAFIVQKHFSQIADRKAFMKEAEGDLPSHRKRESSAPAVLDTPIPSLETKNDVASSRKARNTQPWETVPKRVPPS